MPVHPQSHSQIKMAERAVGEVHIHEPAISAQLVRQPRPHRDDLAREIARRVDQMAAMRQHVVAFEVRLGVGGRLAGVGAGDDGGLHRAGHGVAVGRVAVPRLQRDQLAHAVVDEAPCRHQPLVKPLHVADLEDLAGLTDGGGQLLRLIERGGHRLFAQHMLARRQRLDRGGNVEGVGGGDDDGFELWICQHGVVIGIGFLRREGCGHAVSQIVGDIADGIEIGVARLDAAFEMRRLGDLAAAQHPHPQRPRVLLGHRCPRSGCAGPPTSLFN